MKFALVKFLNSNNYFLYCMHNKTHKWSGYFPNIQSCFKVPLKNYHTDPTDTIETFEDYINTLDCKATIVFETDDIHTALDTHPELLI